MANNLTLNVSENFDLQAMADTLCEQYQAKGYTTKTLKMKNGVKIKVEKNTGGINTLLGMGEAITATCMLTGKEKDVMNVSFGEGDWTGKIIGLTVGWFLCLIPAITSILGVVRQLDLPKVLENDITVLASEE